MRPLLRRHPLGLALLLVLSCKIEQFPTGPGPVESVSVTPNAVSLLAGESATLRAYALDSTRALVSTASAPTWTSSAGLVATVSSAGVVQALAAGTAVITATIEGKTSTSTVTVSARPFIALNPGAPSLSATAGSNTPGQQVVNVTNGGGGALTGLSLGSVTYQPGQPAGWLSSATLSGTTAPATVTLTATSGTLPAGTYSATLPVASPVATNTPQTLNVSFTVNAAQPGSIAVNAGDNQTAPVATQLPIAPSVIVRDAFGNPAPGAGVVFAVTSGGGTITGASQMTNGSGVATVGSWTLGTAAGSQTMTATSGTISGSPLTITATATPGSAFAIAVSAGDNQTAVVGTAVGVPPAVMVTDQYGNAVSGTVVDFAVARGGGGLTGNTSPTSGTNGIAAVGGWTMGAARDTNTVTATATGLNGSPLTFTARGAWSLATHVQPQLFDPPFSGATGKGCAVTGCHVAGGALAPQLGTAAASYQSLLNGNGTATKYITPGDTTGNGATSGVLLFRLKSTSAPMPPGAAGPLSSRSASLYALIRDWILDGALP